MLSVKQLNDQIINLELNIDCQIGKGSQKE